MKARTLLMTAAAFIMAATAANAEVVASGNSTKVRSLLMERGLPQVLLWLTCNLGPACEMQ